MNKPKKKDSKPNVLINESSPYLLQHAHNPVDWHPWNEETLQKAKAQKKPLLISIGYSACHWCHVMERESFEDKEVAEVMNKNFICIKVDREERPDIDQIYMDAVQLMRQSGGWPLNCFALPDGRPIYGGTYFQRDTWLNLCKQIHEFYTKKNKEATDYAQNLTINIQQLESVAVASKSEKGYSQGDLEKIYTPWCLEFDHIHGGTNKAPKFPMPNNWLFLLRYAYFSNEPSAFQAVQLTLDKMAMGGIYDQIGGGFARYSTDTYWLVPHFEKMLYDNAQLVSLYCEAYRKFKKPRYRQLVYDTLEFVMRELTSPENGFYSALDADSDGEEGKYYVWTQEEIDKLLQDRSAVLSIYYNTISTGNWEHRKNILHQTRSDDEIARLLNITPEKLQNDLELAKAILLKTREKRSKPGLDDKILTSWNAMMCKAFVDAYRTFGKKSLLDAAKKNMLFIEKNLTNGDQLFRNYKNGKATINGYLEDYAFVIQALLSLYEATFDEKFLTRADKLTQYVLVHFYDNSSGMFYFTSDEDPPLIARKMEIYDNVIPASNSVMANNLLTLSSYYYNENYGKKAKQMLANVMEKVGTNEYGLTAFSNWALLLSRIVFLDKEVVIMGKKALTLRAEFEQEYIPNVLLAGGTEASTLPILEGKGLDKKTLIYVCQNKSCQAPTETVAEVLKLLK